MERGIIFRGIRKDNNDWVYGDLMTEYVHHEGLTIVQHGCIYNEVNPETVGQLVKEYNGARCFEGDIGRTKDEGKLIIILTWIDQHSLFGWLTPEEYEQNKAGNLDFDKVLFWTYAFSDDSAKGIEVIGNIYDNPELLK